LKAKRYKALIFCIWNRRKLFIILAIVFFVGTSLFWGEDIQQAAGQGGSGIGSILASPFALLSSIGTSQSLREAAETLALENEALKGKIVLLQKNNSLSHEARLVEAPVFSSYPFNHKNLLFIEGGADKGFYVQGGELRLKNHFYLERSLRSFLI
jgi:hypothetical protein